MEEASEREGVSEGEGVVVKEMHLVWWLVTLAIIVVGWVQYLWFRAKISVLEFKVRYVQTDLNVAREVLKRHPADALDYVSLVQEA